MERSEIPLSRRYSERVGGCGGAGWGSNQGESGRFLCNIHRPRLSPAPKSSLIGGKGLFEEEVRTISTLLKRSCVQRNGEGRLTPS